MTKEEKILREAIREEIKKTLKEAGYLGRAKKMVTGKVSQMGKLAPVKLLKRALGTGSSDQKAAGILSIVQNLIGDESDKDKILMKLKQKLAQQSIRAEI